MKSRLVAVRDNPREMSALREVIKHCVRMRQKGVVYEDIVQHKEVPSVKIL